MNDYFDSFIDNTDGTITIGISSLLTANGGSLDTVNEQGFIRAFIADLIARSQAGNYPADELKTVRVASSVTSIDYQKSLTVINSNSYIVRTVPIQLISPDNSTFDPDN